MIMVSGFSFSVFSFIGLAFFETSASTRVAILSSTSVALGGGACLAGGGRAPHRPPS